jgi:hypothetical protein
MSNNTFFLGQPIFTQLLKLLPARLIQSCASKYNCDRYYKTFKSYDHLVSMLYSSFFKCTSLREVCTGLQACSYKLRHLGLKNTPRRSTLADANKKRTEQFFADVYHALYQHYYKNLPDSRRAKSLESRLFIMDSTTIKLFTDVMKGAGSKPLNGKQKGGAKAHVLVKADEDVPQIIHLTTASKNDKTLLPHIQLPPGSVLVFDMGYNNYKQFQQWTQQKVNWITRLSEVAWVEELSSQFIDQKQQTAGVLVDQKVRLGRPSNKPTTKIIVRKIMYHDKQMKRTFTFITNNFRMKATTIAAIYQKRWQIELLFKRIKKHYPLRYFLGDSENAIKIQIWSAFLADLLIKITKDKIKKRNWSFSNIAGMIRQHLMTYINIFLFLSNPEKALLNYHPPEEKFQLQLNLST